jgi:hypothetical protein
MKKLLSSVAVIVGMTSTAIPFGILPAALPAQADVVVGGTVRVGNTDVYLQYGSSSPYSNYNYPAYSLNPYTTYYRRDPYTNYVDRDPYSYNSYPAYNYPARVYVVPAPTYIVPRYRYSVPGYYHRNYYRPGWHY